MSDDPPGKAKDPKWSLPQSSRGESVMMTMKRHYENLIDGDARCRVSTEKPLQKVRSVKEMEMRSKGYTNASERKDGYTIGFDSKSSKKPIKSGL